MMKPIARESKQEIIQHSGYLYKTGNNKKGKADGHRIKTQRKRQKTVLLLI